MKHFEEWEKVEQNNNQNYLEKVFVFKNFNLAIEFINKVATLSEQKNHHPTIINNYTRVVIQLTTHDAKNTITDLDTKLSIEIDKLM